MMNNREVEGSKGDYMGGTTTPALCVQWSMIMIFAFSCRTVDKVQQLWYNSVALLEKCKKIVASTLGRCFFMVGKRVMITLSEKALKELERLCEKKQMTKSMVITLAIEEMKSKEENRNKE